MAKTAQSRAADVVGEVTWDWWSGVPDTNTLKIKPGVWTTISEPTPYTYVPPEEFQRQVVELIQLLHTFGPKIRLLADVLGAMKIEEEDNAR